MASHPMKLRPCLMIRLRITIADPDHSDEEERYLDIGLSVKQRLLVVWYTEREENIRIIGCRKATQFERKTYEEREERF